MSLPIMEPLFSKEIEVYNKSHLTLDDLVNFTKENVDLSTKVTTLMICSVGTYDIIQFEDAKVCAKIGGHAPIKEISVKNMDDVALVKDLLQKMKLQKKNLQQLLGCDSEVYFTTIVPMNLVMFHDHQLKLHRKETQHELEFKYSVDNLREMQEVIERVLQSLNKITMKNNMATLPLNLFCYPRRLAREDHNKFYSNSSDGLRFSRSFSMEVSSDLTTHIKKVLTKRSKYEKVVFVGDSRLQHVKKAWPEDVRYNCKIITDPELSLGHLSNATDPVMKEICLCKNSLIVISLGIHDLCKLVQHDECDSHEKLKVFVPHLMDNSSDVSYDRIKLSVFMWRIIGNVKRLTNNCDLFFMPMYDFDLLSYQDYLISLHKKETEHTIQKPIISDDKKFTQVFSDTLNILNMYNLICFHISQRYPFMLRTSPSWMNEKGMYDDGTIRRISSSVLLDGIHPSPALAKDMAERFHNFADQALKIKFWIADKFVSPATKDYYLILAKCRDKVDFETKGVMEDIHNVKDSDDLDSRTSSSDKTWKTVKKDSEDLSSRTSSDDKTWKSSKKDSEDLDSRTSSDDKTRKSVRKDSEDLGSRTSLGDTTWKSVRKDSEDLGSRTASDDTTRKSARKDSEDRGSRTSSGDATRKSATKDSEDLGSRTSGDKTRKSGRKDSEDLGNRTSSGDTTRKPLKKDYENLGSRTFSDDKTRKSARKDSEDLGSRTSSGDKTRKSVKKEEIWRYTEVHDPASKEERSSYISKNFIDSKILESLSDISGSDSECPSTRVSSSQSKHSGHHATKSSHKPKQSDVRHKSFREEEHGHIKGYGHPPTNLLRGNISHSFPASEGHHSRSRSPVHMPRKYERTVSYPIQESYMGFRSLSEKRRNYSRFPSGRRSCSRSRSRSPSYDKFTSSSRSRLLSGRRSRSRSRSRSSSVENYLGASSRSHSPRRDQESIALSSLREVHNRECAAYRKHPNAHPDYEKEFRKYRDKKMQCIIGLGGDPNAYDITKDWEKFWSTRMEELLKQSWVTKKDKCLEMLKLSKSKRNSSPTKSEAEIRLQSKYASSSKLKRKKFRSRSSSRERLTKQSFRKKDVKAKKRRNSPDSSTSSSDNELSNRPDDRREDSSESDKSNKPEKAYNSKIMQMKEDKSLDSFETRRQREQEQMKSEYEKEMEQKKLKNKLINEQKNKLINEQKNKLINEQILGKYQQKDLNLPGELIDSNVIEMKFLTGLREKEMTSLKVREDSFMRDIVADARNIPEPLSSLLDGRGNTEQPNIMKQSTQEAESVLSSSEIFHRDESRLDGFVRNTDETALHKTALSGKYSLPSTSKEEPADEVTSTTPSFEVGKQEDLTEILEILTRLGDRLNVLKVPLKVVYDKALHYKSLGLDSTKLLDEKEAKTLLHLISSKLSKMIKEENLNIIQKVIIQEANERLKNILKASGPDLNTSLIAEKCLGKNEADTIAYIQSQFLEGGSYEVSHDQLKQIYEAVQSEKSKLLAQILKKSTVTREESPKTAAPPGVREKAPLPHGPVDNYSPHPQWSSEESQEVDTSYPSQLQELKLKFASKKHHEDSPTERLLRDLLPRKSFEAYPCNREMEDFTSRSEIDKFLSKSRLEEPEHRKRNEDYSSERYFSDEKSSDSYENISSKTQLHDCTPEKQLKDISLKRHLNDFLLRKSVDNVPIKKKFEGRAVEDSALKTSVEHYPSQRNIEEYQSRRELKDFSSKRKNEDIFSNLPGKRTSADKDFEEFSLPKQRKDFYPMEEMEDLPSQRYSKDLRGNDSSTTNAKIRYGYPSTSAVSSLITEMSKERGSSSYSQKESEDLSRFLPKSAGFNLMTPSAGEIPNLSSFLSQLSPSTLDMATKGQTQEKVSSENFRASFLKNPIRLVIPKQQKQGSSFNPIRQSMDDNSW